MSESPGELQLMLFSFLETPGAPGVFPLSLIFELPTTTLSESVPFIEIADLSMRYFAPVILEKSALKVRPVSVNSSGVEANARYFLPFINTYFSLDVGRLPFSVAGR